MLILGFTKTTLLDYPTKVAATIFAGGCNFRCPYCHNGQMVTNCGSISAIPMEEIESHLIKRKGVLEGVCISGGEATLHADLEELVRKIKGFGYLVKLDTNGSNPHVLNRLINDKLVDYVAMDVKNTYAKYKETTGAPDGAIENVKKSIDLLNQSGILFEFRTTVVKELHTLDDLKEISRMIGPASNWYIQSYIESENVLSKGLHAYDDDELKKMVSLLERNNVMLRGV